jgi:hypothetical protein
MRQRLFPSTIFDLPYLLLHRASSKNKPQCLFLFLSLTKSPFKCGNHTASNIVSDLNPHGHLGMQERAISIDLHVKKDV